MSTNQELTAKLYQVSRKLFGVSVPDGVESWSITTTARAGKKWQAVIIYEDGHRKTVPFGAAGMEDYTQHHDEARRQRFLSRFARLIDEHEYDITSAMFYSYHLLW